MRLSARMSPSLVVMGWVGRARWVVVLGEPVAPSVKILVFL